MGIWDWGLGIGDWPIPNPQSPYTKSKHKNYFIIFKMKNKIYFNLYLN